MCALAQNDASILDFCRCGGVLAGGQSRPPLHNDKHAKRTDTLCPSFQRVEKVFSPRCPSSFLNLKSSENCLIERERGFLPLSLYPRCSIAGLRFIVFLTASNAIHKDGISSLEYGPRGGLRRFARPTHRTSHIDLADCTKSCIRLCVFRGRIGFCEF